MTLTALQLLTVAGHRAGRGTDEEWPEYHRDDRVQGDVHGQPTASADEATTATSRQQGVPAPDPI